MQPTLSYSHADLQKRRAQQAAIPLTLDIFAWYQQMQAEHAVWFDTERASWLVFRYDDVQRVLLDTATFSSQRTTNPDGSVDPIAGGGILGLDDPRHRQLRSLISQAFTPRVVAQLEPRIRAIVRDLLDRVQAQGTMDGVDDLAFPLPILVIAELLGVPIEDQAQFRQWSTDFVGPDYALRLTTSRYIAGYFQNLIAQRRQEPRTDLISALIAAEIEGERLPEADILGTCLLLLVAGHETTVGLISNALVCLDEHPDTWQELLQRPELVPQAVEEILRYRGVVHTLTRVVTTDTEFCGQQLKAGDLVMPLFASANLDERQFPHTATFDIHRTPNRHLGLGHGVHFCLGAPLARLETRVALEELLTRFPNLHRDRGVPLELKHSPIIYSLRHVPLTF